MVWATIELTTRATLVRIDDNSNGDRYIFDILCPVVVFYRRILPNTFYQQDNAKPHAARIIQTFLDTQGNRLSSWPAWSPDLSPIECIWSWVAERLATSTLLLIRLIKSGMYLKQHGMHSSTPCLTG
ncbi:transposable element Tcb2 transposase [Trichonephila clavipes]|nr:transposable element Tcb2 transposase [Trichonephila clavipes]